MAAVRDNAGALTGIHRTWLDPRRPAKADLRSPRKALGRIHRNAVRFGRPLPGGALVAGEGLETVLSIVAAVPGLPAAAALSASHLAAFEPPEGIGLLIVARDSGEDGVTAALRLRNRCRDLGIEAVVAAPRLGDFNDDLVKLGADAVASAIGPLAAASGEQRRSTA